MFQQTIGILMGTDCAPLLSDFFLQFYETDLSFRQSLHKNKDRKLAQSFTSSFRYIYTVLSLNNIDSVIICISSIQMNLK
jgi:hypothetical protein